MGGVRIDVPLRSICAGGEDFSDALPLLLSLSFRLFGRLFLSLSLSLSPRQVILEQKYKKTTGAPIPKTGLLPDQKVDKTLFIFIYATTVATVSS